MAGARPSGHSWSQKTKAEEDEVDPFDQMILRTGCATFHSAVQECMAEHQDWRKCQEQVQSFKTCMAGYQQQRAEALQRRQELAQAPAQETGSKGAGLLGLKAAEQPDPSRAAP